MRLSSKLTLLSKVTILLIGLPMSCVIAIESQYAIWSLAVTLILIVFCVFFAVKTADLYRENETYIFQRLGLGKVSVAPQEIGKIKHFKFQKYSYLWFETEKGSFLVIAPMWGEERTALLNIYDTYQSNLESKPVSSTK